MVNAWCISDPMGAGEGGGGWLFQRVGCLELGPLYRQDLLISLFEFL